MEDYNIFHQEIRAAYPSYGYALWEPDPGRLYNAVEVGDVGFVREGQFHRLFNALLPADHPSHENFGVPESYERLIPRTREHVDKGMLNRKIFCSNYVAQFSRGFESRSSG